MQSSLNLSATDSRGFLLISMALIQQKWLEGPGYIPTPGNDWNSS